MNAPLCENGYVSEYLSHFVGRAKPPNEQFETLCTIVKDGVLLPRGKEEYSRGNAVVRLDRLFSEEVEMFQPEIVCFCDIPLKLELLRLHARNYSRFGLAFEKKFLAKRGANPVLYVARNSACTDHRFPEGHPLRQTTRRDFFDQGVHDWIVDTATRRLREDKNTGAWPKFDNLVFWYLLCYCKFFDEELSRDDPKNYYMEREWRTVGRVTFSRDDIKRVILPAEDKWQDVFKENFPDLGGRITALEKG
jgi:hypothetical protein